MPLYFCSFFVPTTQLYWRGFPWTRRSRSGLKGKQLCVKIQRNAACLCSCPQLQVDHKWVKNAQSPQPRDGHNIKVVSAPAAVRKLAGGQASNLIFWSFFLSYPLCLFCETPVSANAAQACRNWPALPGCRKAEGAEEEEDGCSGSRFAFLDHFVFLAGETVSWAISLFFFFFFLLQRLLFKKLLPPPPHSLLLFLVSW